MTPGRLLTLGALVGLLTAVPSLARAGTLNLKGSDTMVILAQRWAVEYAKLRPTTRIQITGGGSGVGFAALQNGTMDLALASRPIRLAEIEGCIRAFGRRPREHRVALDGLAIYVNEANPVEALSLDQLEGIFRGRLNNWAAVGGVDAPIVRFGRESSSGSYEFFKRRVLGGRDFAVRTQSVSGTAAILQVVAREPHGIGYGGVAYGAGTRHLRIRPTPDEPAIEPTEETILDRRYPIWRYLYIYANPAVETGEAGDFLRWVTGPQGQEVVREVGYCPLPPEGSNP